MTNDEYDPHRWVRRFLPGPAIIFDFMHSTTWFTELASPLGDITLTATEAGLSGLYFKGQRWFPGDDLRARWQRYDPYFQCARIWLRDYFSGLSPVYEAPLDLNGTAFQREVWQTLLSIPMGETRSYSDIAHLLGKPSAARAIGAAIGRNPLSLIIPCHRVVGSKGSLTGYAGGLDRKAALLALEREAMKV
jgi:methylated-DNA-[protein]-cysteine S-methyltransferase